MPKAAKPLTVYHELDPTYYSATSKTFIGRVYALLGLRNIADAADKTGSGYPQLSAEYIVAASPDLIVLADTKCCGQTAAKVGKRGRAGARSRRSKNGDVVAVERRRRLALGAARRRLHPADRGEDARARGRRRGDVTAVPTERPREGGASRVPLPARVTTPVLARASRSSSARSLVGLLVGPVHIGVGDDRAVGRLARAVPGRAARTLSDADEAILWQLRAPRVVLGVLVGGMLALAGGAYQGVFRNPLVDPYLLGVAAGAGLGATLAIAYGGSAVAPLRPAPARRVPRRRARRRARVRARPARRGDGRSPAALVLAGVTVVVVPDRRADVRPAAALASRCRRSTAGSSAASTPSGWHDVALVAPYIVVSSAVILLHRRLLDVLSVGRRGGGDARRQRQPRAARRRRRRDGRHGGGGRGQRADRLRRDHRPALRPPRDRHELPDRAAALAALRRRLPRARAT